MKNSVLFPFTVSNAFRMIFKINKGPVHGSGSYSPASYLGDASLMPGKFVWDLWWTKWHWDLFSSPPLFCVTQFSFIPPMPRAHLLLSRRCCFISEIDRLGKVRLRTIEQRIFTHFLNFSVERTASIFKSKAPP